MLLFFWVFSIYMKFTMFWKKKLNSSVNYFWCYWLRKMGLFKCITGLLSRNPLAVNVLTSPKNPWIKQKSTFILLFHHSEPNWVRKSYFWSDLRFYDCLLRRWLPTRSVFVVVERIYRYQFKSNYVKNEDLFAGFSLTFWYLH